MVQQVKERISETKKHLRKQTLDTILEQFDARIMKLENKDRRAKYEKMKQNPYSFFRGSAYLFYFDVTKIPFHYHTPQDKPTWILGDLHFDNYSCFQDHAGNLVFDVDDFDEGYLGSYLYDILRMVVSIRLFGEQQGFGEADQDQFVEIYLKAYIKKLKKFAAGDKDPVTTQFTIDNTKGPIKKTLKKLEERKNTHKLEKKTIVNETGERRLNREDAKLSSVSNNVYKELVKTWDAYLAGLMEESFKGHGHYQIKDIVKKTGAGIGSTGLKRYYLLIEGEEEGHTDDVLLEAKEARTPIPAYFFPYNDAFWEQFRHQGKRVISTQQAMHHRADPYLGFFTMRNHDFYVRERSPYEKDVKAKYFKEFKDVKQTLKTMAKVTAKIHARVDKDVEDTILDSHSEEEILQAIGEDDSGFKKEMSTWSKHYKEQVEGDYQLFLEWLEERFYAGKKGSSHS